MGSSRWSASSSLTTSESMGRRTPLMRYVGLTPTLMWRSEASIFFIAPKRRWIERGPWIMGRPSALRTSCFSVPAAMVTGAESCSPARGGELRRAADAYWRHAQGLPNPRNPRRLPRRRVRGGPGPAAAGRLGRWSSPRDRDGGGGERGPAALCARAWDLEAALRFRLG